MSKRVITQRHLREIIRIQEEISAAKSALSELQANLAIAEGAVISDMRSADGYRIEPGKYTAVIESRLGACRPPWKDVYLTHFEREHGVPPKAEEERIRTLYPPKTSDELVVGERK